MAVASYTPPTAMLSDLETARSLVSAGVPGNPRGRPTGIKEAVIATDRIPQPVLGVRNPRDDYTTAALRQKEALAKQ